MPDVSSCLLAVLSGSASVSSPVFSRTGHATGCGCTPASRRASPAAALPAAHRRLEWHKVSNQRMRCLRITAKEEKLVRKKMVRYQELETRRDGIKFTNKALKDAAGRLQQLSGDYDSRQQHLVEQASDAARSFSAGA
jgi:hypothetical protein